MSEVLELLKESVRILEEREAKAIDPAEGKVQLSTLAAGDLLMIGDHELIVLEQKDGKAAVISKELLAKNKVFDEDTRNYKESSLKRLIESEIQPVIEAVVGAENLVEHVVDLTSMDMQNEFGACTCKVRPITFDEGRKYNNLLVNRDLGDWFWTCTPWSTEERGWGYSVAVVSPSGDIRNFNCDGINGIRPFCILKSNIFVSKVEA